MQTTIDRLIDNLSAYNLGSILFDFTDAGCFDFNAQRAGFHKTCRCFHFLNQIDACFDFQWRRDCALFFITCIDGTGWQKQLR